MSDSSGFTPAPVYDSIFGFFYEPKFEAIPRLLSVVETSCSSGFRGGGGEPSPGRWSFDYSFTPYGKYRVGNGSDLKLRQAFEAHLYPPCTVVYYDTFCNTDNGRTRNIYLSFANGEQSGLLPLVQQTGYARFLDPYCRLGPMLERMLFVTQEQGDDAFLLAQGILCEIFSLIYNSSYVEEGTYIISQAHSTPPQSDFIRKVRAYFLSHIGDDVTQEMLAEHLGLSLSSISHRYQRETGESPMTTLTNMRVSLAKTLLLDGYRMRNIAAYTGFCDEFHLSKAFKNVEGISPRDFRKQHSGK